MAPDVEPVARLGRWTAATLAITAALIAHGTRPTLEAQTRVAVATASSGADLRRWDAAVDQMARDGDLQSRRIDRDPLLADRIHERFDQYVNGVPVYGADIARQSVGGLTVSVFGTIYPDLQVDVTAALSAEDAAAIIARESGVALGPANLPHLLILPAATNVRLVYHASAFNQSGGVEYFIDAADGSVVQRLDAARSQSAVGTGIGVLGDTKKLSVTAGNGVYFTDDLLRPPLLRTFDLKSNLSRTLTALNGFGILSDADRAADTDNAWTDPAVVDAPVYAGYVYDYYYKRFGRHGLDNNNLRLQSVVHPVDRAAFASVSSLYTTNAFYAGNGLMVYGEGLPPGVLTSAGQRWTYLSGALDVVGHELTHGVTEYTSGLIYQGESGALNESFSDMMGTSIESFYQPPGNGPLQADYLCGEDVVTPGRAGALSGLRSMADPAAYGDPDHYSRRYVGIADNGGVHTNSGIGNQVYYLAIEGGTNRTSGLSVQGVGAANRDQIERVMYRAFTLLMPSSATFAVARAATIQAALDLYGAGSAAERAVTQAWTAVGVN